MRFISPSGGLRIVVIHDKTVPDASGRNYTTKPGYTAEFKQGLLDGYEHQLARGLTYPGGVRDRQNVDGSPFDVTRMAGVFDSAWIEDDELRAEVEQRLLANDGCGKPDSFILVEKERVPAPWPSYDALNINGRRTGAHVAEKNLEIAAATGVPVEDLIAYERENRNDEKVIAAYEAALTASPEPEEELVRA